MIYNRSVVSKNNDLLDKGTRLVNGSVCRCGPITDSWKFLVPHSRNCFRARHISLQYVAILISSREISYQTGSNYQHSSRMSNDNSSVETRRQASAGWFVTARRGRTWLMALKLNIETPDQIANQSKIPSITIGVVGVPHPRAPRYDSIIRWAEPRFRSDKRSAPVARALVDV